MSNTTTVIIDTTGDAAIETIKSQYPQATVTKGFWGTVPNRILMDFPKDNTFPGDAAIKKFLEDHELGRIHRII